MATMRTPVVPETALMKSAQISKPGANFGAQAILATAPNSKAMSELIDGLGPNGKLIVVGAEPAPIEVTPIQLISGSRSIQGWSMGTPADSEEH